MPWPGGVCSLWALGGPCGPLVAGGLTGAPGAGLHLRYGSLARWFGGFLAGVCLCCWVAAGRAAHPPPGWPLACGFASGWCLAGPFGWGCCGVPASFGAARRACWLVCRCSLPSFLHLVMSCHPVVKPAHAPCLHCLRCAFPHLRAGGLLPARLPLLPGVWRLQLLAPAGHPVRSAHHVAGVSAGECNAFLCVCGHTLEPGPWTPTQQPKG